MRSYKHKKRNKKKIGAVGRNIIIMICCLVCAFVATVIVGTVLGKKADSIITDTSEETSSPQSGEDAIHTFNPLAFSVNANYFNIDKLTDAEVNSKISSELRSETTAVVIYMLDKDGKPSYNSAVAKQFYGSGSCNESLNLGTLLSKLHGEGIKICVCFDTSAYETQDKNARYAKIAYERALIGEVVEAGAEEILISGINITDDFSLNNYLSFINDLKTNYTDTFFGVSFEHTYYINDNISPILYAMSAVADFAAMDVSELSETVDVGEFLDQNKYYIDRYNLRVVFQYADDNQYTEFINLLKAKGIYNWQVSRK